MQYVCPFCQVAQVVQGKQRYLHTLPLDINGNCEGKIGCSIEAIVCANPNCANTKLSVNLVPVARAASGFLSIGETIESWSLRPQSAARPLPDYIPQAIREDYQEASRIRDLSPKASATLIRRCIQGMIRNFCGVSHPTLHREIQELRHLVDSGHAPSGVSMESIDAIDRIRQIGNIGAHMERDIDMIVPVDPGEAQLLIELTEMLFDEWYIARAKRQARFDAIASAADAKADLRKGLLPAPRPGEINSVRDGDG